MSGDDQSLHDQFGDLFVRNQARLYRYIFSLVPNRADADDLFQQTNLTLWRTWARYDPVRPFLPWAYAVALNHVRNFSRSGRHRMAQFSEDLQVRLIELRVDEDDLLERRQRALTGCLDKLPSRQAELVGRYYGGQESVRTAAERTGRSVDALYKSIQRIRAALLDCITRTLAQEADS